MSAQADSWPQADSADFNRATKTAPSIKNKEFKTTITRPNSLKTAGFTLTEILIVLAIVALLAAIIFPVAARIREKSRSATCASNLKQIALGVQQYVGDSDGQYPSAGLIGTDQKQWAARRAPFVRNSQIFVCPTRQVLGGSNGLNGSAGLNYDYNVLRLNQFSSRRLNGRGESAVLSASDVWLNTDGDVNGPHSYPAGASKCGDWWMPQWGQELHSDGANYSFVDGHVKWLNPGQIEAIECGLGDPNFAN